MRTLTPATIYAKNQEASAPYCILKWELGGAVGTKWLALADAGAADGSAWNATQGRVVSFGSIGVQLAIERRVNVVGQCTLTLRDDDHVVAGWFASVEPQRTICTIYHQFAGLAEADLVPVMKGIANAPVRWSEDRHSVTLDVTDLSTLRDVTVGNLASRETFADVHPMFEDRMLPIVVGKVKRSPTVPAQFGAVTELARAASDSAPLLYVTNAEKFPQNTAISLYVNGEIIDGSFIGNVFHVTARGAAVYTGTVTSSAENTANGEYYLVDNALTGADESWNGHVIEITTPDGVTQRRLVVHYDGTNHRLTWLKWGLYSGPFWDAGAEWLPTAGYAYNLSSWARSHPSGARVYQYGMSRVYIVNDAPSKAVHAVEGFGRRGEDDSYETYIPISPASYVVDLNDTTSFPSLGRAVTTVTFAERPPAHLGYLFRDDTLWVDIDGIESDWDSTGTVIENPSDVIAMFHERFMSMTLGTDTDSASFADAATRTAPLKMAFTLSEQRQAIDLLADLAYQSRCAEIWDAGTVRLLFLTNALSGTGVGAIGDARYLGTVGIERRDYHEIITEIACTYVDQAQQQTTVVRSSSAEALYGRRAVTENFWAYSSEPAVRAVAQFWLNRRRYIIRRASLTDSPRRVNLTLGDVVTLDMTDWFAAGTLGRVVGIDHTLDSPAVAAPIEANYWPGGCDTVLEAYDDDPCWACETTCQAFCELSCTTTAEINGCGETCVGACETGCQTGCQADCQSGCETTCQVDCQTDCETGCEYTCESEAQGCGSACEIGCETGCEACETSCQGGCQVACESECQSAACQTGCEAECETSACESACQVTCQTSCQECETACQVGCQADCEVTGCMTFCQVSSCQSGCELTCESGCQTGCEVTCETGCETGCEDLCETSCQTGCETSCQTGCETSCETGCEVTCQTGCQVTCQTGCQTSCETGCETAVQADKYYCFRRGNYTASGCATPSAMNVHQIGLGSSYNPTCRFIGGAWLKDTIVKGPFTLYSEAEAAGCP